MPNQNPEQIARDKIDKLISECGWVLQSKQSVNLNAGLGVAVREYQTDVGPADYVLLVDKKPLSPSIKETYCRMTLAFHYLGAYGA